MVDALRSIATQYYNDDSIDPVGSLAFEVESEEVATALLNDLSESAEDEDEFYRRIGMAWARVRALFQPNLTDWRMLRVGPANEDGSLSTDNGLYIDFLVGRTADGSLAGFFVASVET